MVSRRILSVRLGPLVALIALAVWASTALAPPAKAARLKDVVQLEGARANQLVGYGLVVGLDRTGDSLLVPFTQQSLEAMLSRMGIRVDANQISLRNVAAVTVTVDLPAFSQPGTKLDVVVSSIGDARSLAGGTLLMTPLNGVDGKTYAMAQGPLQVGGFGVQGNTGSRIQKNQLNVGRVASGAIVERVVPTQLIDAEGAITLQVRKPDFSTAQRIAQAVNDAAGNLGAAGPLAQVASSGAVRIEVPEAERENLGKFISALEALQVEPDTIARVVINSRTGTVVLGENVRIASVAVAHGGLTLEVQEALDVVQPNAFGAGQTAAAPTTDVNATEREGSLKVVQGSTTLAEVVGALNALGATPRDLIDILQAIAASGALQGELEVL